MPPKRRTTTPRTTSATRQQSTLSFNGKGSRITKAQQHQQNGKTLDLDAKKKQALYDEASVTHDEELQKQQQQQQAENNVIDIEATPTSKQPTAKEEEAEAEAEEKEEDPLNTTTSSTTASVLGGQAKPSDVGAVDGPKGSGWVGDEEARARKISETQINKFWREKESARLVPRVHQEDLDVHEKVLRLWDISGEYGPCIGIARLKRWKRANVLGLKPPIEVLAVLLKEMEHDDGKDGAKVQRAYVDTLMSSRFVET